MEKKEKDWQWLAYALFGFSCLIIAFAVIYFGVCITNFIMDTTP